MQNFSQEIFSQREGWPFSIKSKCSWDVRSEFRDESQIWVEDWLHTFANSHTANQGWHHHHGEVSLSLFKAPTYFCQPTKKALGGHIVTKIDVSLFVFTEKEGKEASWCLRCFPPSGRQPTVTHRVARDLRPVPPSPPPPPLLFLLRIFFHPQIHIQTLSLTEVRFLERPHPSFHCVSLQLLLNLPINQKNVKLVTDHGRVWWMNPLF